MPQIITLIAYYYYCDEESRYVLRIASFDEDHKHFDDVIQQHFDDTIYFFLMVVM